MITIVLLLVTAVLIDGQAYRPYNNIYNPRIPPEELARPDAPYVRPDAPYVRPNVRDYRVNPYYDETPKPYSFSYNAPLEDGGSSSRTESADGSGRVEGSYTVMNDEGHSRVVDYYADEGGFRATVRTNEPGTDSKSPADVVMLSSAGPLTDYPGDYRGDIRRPFQPALNAAVQPAVTPLEVADPAREIIPPVGPGYRRPGLYPNRGAYPGYRRPYNPGYRYPGYN